MEGEGEKWKGTERRGEQGRGEGRGRKDRKGRLVQKLAQDLVCGNPGLELFNKGCCSCC